MKYQSSGNLQHSKVYIKVEFNVYKNQRGIFQKYKTKPKSEHVTDADYRNKTKINSR